MIKKELRKSIKFEVIGGKVEIIGSSIYPKEEGWKLLCPHCSKRLHISLVWDQDACEFQLIIVEGE